MGKEQGRSNLTRFSGFVYRLLYSGLCARLPSKFDLQPPG